MFFNNFDQDNIQLFYYIVYIFNYNLMKIKDNIACVQNFNNKNLHYYL